MNEVITNLMNQWGFNMPTEIYMPMVYIISTIAFSLVFWMISKIVCPNASAMRSFVMKYVCVVMAIVVCLSCLATSGIKIETNKTEADITLEYRGEAIAYLLESETSAIIEVPNTSFIAEYNGVLITGYQNTVQINNTPVGDLPCYIVVKGQTIHVTRGPEDIQPYILYLPTTNVNRLVDIIQ